MPRKILHVDLDAFFCSVEEKRDPSLRGKAFVVGGSPSGRGVVTSASYPARAYGIRSAMPAARALRLCPGLLFVRGAYPAYHTASEAVIERLNKITPLVEPISIDEAFLDVSDLPQSELEIARSLQRQIWEELGLPCSIGVASNKLVAKMATDAGKVSRRDFSGPPQAILVVPPGKEVEFLAPLPAQALWGIGPKTAERLRQHGINFLRDIQHLTPDQLDKLFGNFGAELLARALGIDDRPVHPEHQAKSISNETTFGEDIREREALLETIHSLSEHVCTRLRRADLVGSTVRVKLRWADFTTITRQTSLDPPSSVDSEVFATAVELFASAWTPRRPVRLVGVGVSGLRAACRQLGLWETRPERETRLLEAIDSLRDRYGSRIIQRASRLGKNR